METIPIAGAEVYYARNLLPAEKATVLYEVLLAMCAWQRHRTSFKSLVPREEAYYGGPNIFAG
jgi:hypothetical protein